METSLTPVFISRDRFDGEDPDKALVDVWRREPVARHLGADICFTADRYADNLLATVRAKFWPQDWPKVASGECWPAQIDLAVARSLQWVEKRH